MGSVHTIVFCSSIILVLLPWSVTSNFTLPPIFSPIFDDLCKHVECGKGTCKASNNTLGYVCECEPGWKQTRSEHDDDLKFLPCVVPNCTLDFSCANAPSAAPAKEKRTNDSFFDPCRWVDCGGGICNKTSVFTHTCECNQGYYNLLNVTAFPCLKECALGMDCSTIGIDVINKSSSPPSLPENSNNQGEISSPPSSPENSNNLGVISSPPNLPENSNNQAFSTSIHHLNWKILISLALAFVLFK